MESEISTATRIMRAFKRDARHDCGVSRITRLACPLSFPKQFVILKGIDSGLRSSHDVAPSGERISDLTRSKNWQTVAIRLRRLLFNFDGVHARVVHVGDERDD